MPAPLARVQLKVKDGGTRSRVVKPGDTVHIVEPFDKFLLEDISTFPPPHIVDIVRHKGSKRGQQHELKVQFQTKDKTTHQALFFPNQLLASKAAFLIGDEVMVHRIIKPLVVPLHTTGVVVGGDGDFYHVSFVLQDFDPPVTVSQDFVPAEALTYSTKKKHPRGVSKLEKSSASTVGLVEQPTIVEDTPAPPPPPPAPDQNEDDPPLLQKAACHLQPHVFNTFKEWVRGEHNNTIHNSTHLQGLVVQFLRQQQQPTTSGCNPAVLIALRQAGATQADIDTLAQSRDFTTLCTEDAIERFLNL